MFQCTLPKLVAAKVASEGTYYHRGCKLQAAACESSIALRPNGCMVKKYLATVATFVHVTKQDNYLFWIDIFFASRKKGALVFRAVEHNLNLS